MISFFVVVASAASRVHCSIVFPQCLPRTEHRMEKKHSSQQLYFGMQREQTRKMQETYEQNDLIFYSN